MVNFITFILHKKIRASEYSTRTEHLGLKRKGTSNLAVKEGNMLSWALTFFIVAIVAAIFGFTGIAGAAAGIAQFLFFLFVILLVISLIANAVRGRPPRA